MIKARENKIQSTDLLVCFPKRAHLTLTHKPISSPSRPSEANKRPTNNHNLKRLNIKPSGSGSPSVRHQRVVIAEPTSPKVTCAGQIKVRPSSSSKSWQSVMEEIERIHNHRTKLNKKKSTKWGVENNNLGFFKKDVMSFLTCLRNIRFDFQCFGAFPQTHHIISSSSSSSEQDEDEFEICEDAHHQQPFPNETDHNNNNAVFSKWFMVLQDNNNSNKEKDKTQVQDDDSSSSPPAVPPPNALLLMRCRSAPAKSWLEENSIIEQQQQQQQQQQQVPSVVAKQDDDVVDVVKQHQNNNKRDSLAILMKYDADFFNLSSDISHETWLVGGFKDSSFSRSRSWRR